MGVWSFADEHTGVLTGAAFHGELGLLSLNTPSGCVAIPGQHDHTRVRVDLETGGLVSYQPPSPAADDWQTWAWDADAWRWVSVPTAAALAREARAERDRRLLACDWTDTASAPARLGAVLYAAWQDYRQALRDVSAQPGFPHTITWPEEPTP